MYFLYNTKLVSSIMTGQARAVPSPVHLKGWVLLSHFTWLNVVSLCRNIDHGITNKGTSRDLHTGWAASEKSQVGRLFYDGYISCDKDQKKTVEFMFFNA